ncbi:MAG: hypothetical protein ACTS4T_00795 [Candidatus Hodgkinia cicadicola]
MVTGRSTANKSERKFTLSARLAKRKNFNRPEVALSSGRLVKRWNDVNHPPRAPSNGGRGLRLIRRMVVWLPKNGS